MNIDTPVKPVLDEAIDASFRLSGRFVDEEVAKGRHLDDVLSVEQDKPGGEYWFNREALKHYSTAVRSSQVAN